MTKRFSHHFIVSLMSSWVYNWFSLGELSTFVYYCNTYARLDTDQNANSLNMTHTTGSPFKQNMIGGCTNNVHSIMWQMCQVLPKIVSFSRLFLEIILLHCAWWATTTKVETRTGWNHFGNNSFREHFSAKLGGRLCGKEVSKHTWTHKMILNVMSRTLAQYFPDRWSTHSFIASGKGFGFKHSVG